MNTIKFYNIEILSEQIRIRRVTRPFLSMRMGGDQTNTEPPRFVALKPSKFYDPHPLSMYHSPINDNELLVPLKYYVIIDDI